jgi:hypothetical protein
LPSTRTLQRGLGPALKQERLDRNAMPTLESTGGNRKHELCEPMDIKRFNPLVPTLEISKHGAGFRNALAGHPGQVWNAYNANNIARMKPPAVSIFWFKGWTHHGCAALTSRASQLARLIERQLF